MASATVDVEIAPPVARPRDHATDWLRVIAVALLIPFHSAMIFVPWSYHIKNADTSRGLEFFNFFLGVWHMPLLFFLSGAGTWYALGHRTAGGYVVERLRRLFVPLVFGILVIIPPQTYLERLQRGEFHGSLLAFYPHFFEGVYPQGNFTWNHLWFLAYLFTFSILSLPLFTWARGRRGSAWLRRNLPRFESAGALLLLALPLMVVQATLRVRWPGLQSLIDDWANFCFYLIAFWYGYFLSSHGGIAATIARRRSVFLALGCCGFLALASVGVIIEQPPWSYNLSRIAMLVLQGATTWCWILALVGYARHWLQRSGPLLEYAKPAALPCYVLHQTVILAIGYFVVQWDAGIPAKFTCIVVSSTCVTVLLYDLLVRRFLPLRFLFGMRTARTPRGSR